MEQNKSYFGEIADAMKTLATGMKVTLKEYFTPKSTEQYPENRKTTLHVAKRHRGRLVFKRNEDGSYKPATDATNWELKPATTEGE